MHIHILLLISLCYFQLAIPFFIGVITAPTPKPPLQNRLLRLLEIMGTFEFVASIWNKAAFVFFVALVRVWGCIGAQIWAFVDIGAV